MKKTVNLFGSLDGFDRLNIGWQNVGGRSVSYGDQSPASDDQGEWFPHVPGDLRLFVGDGSLVNFGWRCVVAGTPGTWVLLDVGAGAGSAVTVFDTIAALEAFPTPVVGDIYLTRGYLAPYDGGGAQYYYSMADGRTVGNMFIFPTVNGGATRYLRNTTGLGEISLASGGIVDSSVTPQGVKLQNIYDEATAFGFRGTLRIPPATHINITDGNRIFGDGPKLKGSGKTSVFVGAAHGSGAASVAWGSHFVGNVDTLPYGTNTWTQDLTSGAGIRSTSAMDSVAGLAIGQNVCVRYGADPTDQGLAYWYHFTQIIDIVGNIVTFREPLPDDVPAGIGMNIQRLTNKHDIMVADRYCLDFETSDFATDNVLIANSYCKGWHLHHVDVIYGQQMFASTYDTNTYAHDLVCDEGTYFPAIHSWFFTGWSHQNLLLERVYSVQVGTDFHTQEGQNRETTIRDWRLQTGNPAFAPPSDNMSLTTFGAGGARAAKFQNGNITGYGQPSSDSYATYENLVITGFSGDGLFPTGPMSVQLQTNQITGLLYYRNTYWRRTVQSLRMTMPIIPGAIGTPRGTDMKFPIVGIPRRVGVRVSSKVGLNAIEQHSSTKLFDLLPALVVNQFVEQPSSTLLGTNLPGGYGDGTPTPAGWFIRVIANDTVPAGQVIEVDLESFVSDDTPWIAAQPLAEIVTQAPPTVNADFVGQWAYNSLGKFYHRAVQVGYGVADWGVVGTEIPIANLTLVDAAAWDVPIPVGAYRRLRLLFRFNSGDATTWTMTLTGAAGTYKIMALYASDGSAPGATGSATTWISGISFPGIFDCLLVIEPGGIRSFNGWQEEVNGGGAGVGLYYFRQGFQTDQVNPITNLHMIFAGGTPKVTGSVEVWGLQ